MKKRKNSKQSAALRLNGFTLVELLIVVSIIALLAAIAIPHYYDSIVRAKTARTIEDMSYVSRLLASYSLDAGSYPADNISTPYTALLVLTTPVAYAHDLPLDVYRSPGDPDYGKTFFYGLRKGEFEEVVTEAAKKHRNKACEFALASYGPDMSWLSRDGATDSYSIPYDSTNGTVSEGNIWLFGP